ncbi:MAG TPA: hypothetical protein VG329_02345 [Candidatus Dormibacteraeota bacterium]|nr:hypothetical protein [Candidatus Dormibacteraeota bacterium]
MPMRVGDTPEGGTPDAGAAPVPGAPIAEDPEAAKKKKGGDDGVLEDAAEAAGWGCAILSCFDCLSVLAISAVTTALVVERARRKRRLAEDL